MLCAADFPAGVFDGFGFQTVSCRSLSLAPQRRVGLGAGDAVARRGCRAAGVGSPGRGRRGSQATAAVAFALWLLAAFSALHFWWRQTSGALHWDGQSWVLEPGRPSAAILVLSGSPQVLVDLQSRLWVHVRFSEGGSAWLWLDRSLQPERWVDLRRAVYSRARPGADNADKTAPASASRHGRES